MLKKTPAMGPYAPPEPMEADQKGIQPMAVARDIDTPHDAAMPTTARLDAHTNPDLMARSGRETRAEQGTKGRVVDENGFRDVFSEDAE